MNPSTPLRPETLTSYGEPVEIPGYDRTAVARSIMHLGVGGFHRSHLATYVDELCRAGHTEWGIVGCGVLDGDRRMAEVMAEQHGLYTLIVRSASQTSVQVIGSIVDYVHAAIEPGPAIDRIADPATQIVSLTITEGGYPVDDLTGKYLEDSPNAGPGSAFRLIAAGLEARRTSHGAPITVMSCDNIMGNGHVAQAATLGEASAWGPELLEWIESSVSFPNSMVDRITPATAPNDRAWLADTHGVDDQWPVVTEPFRQWVIEDNFAGARPPLEELDVIITDDVEPYEFMKLRLLNAGHSCMAYLSALLGHETVDAAMQDPLIERYLAAFLNDESKPVLPPVAGIDVDAYIETTIDRFRNPEIGDQIVRLCLDGTAKFPKFLVPTIRAQISTGGPVALSALAVAGWCHYLTGGSDDGPSNSPAPDSGLAEAVAAAQASVGDPAAFLALDGVFGDEVRESEAFVAAFSAALGSLRTVGVAATIASTLSHSDATSPR